jgi:Ca2+:H+ antiporter
MEKRTMAQVVESPPQKAKGQPDTGPSLIKKVLYGMLVFIPMAIFAEVTHQSPTLIFVLSALGIIPLADLIGEATEELSLHTGPRIGGLLNATLGNAAELIITIFAINRGLLDLVKASITGSIIGNLLLVMGASLLFGGLKNGTQKFDRRHAATNATLLVLAVVALVIPSIFDAALRTDVVGGLGRELHLSEGIAVIMIILYGLSVFYSFTGGSHSDAAHVAQEDEPHTPKWSVQRCLIMLALATLGIVFMSEFLVGAVESVTETLGLTEFFIGIIVIPVVGNIAEHLVAVEVAYKNKMELSLAVSIGSSLQIALFVAPVLVFIALLFGKELLLVFTPYELITLVAASLIAAFISQDGESNWLEGAMLLAVYLIVALAFFFLPGAAGSVH